MTCDTSDTVGGAGCVLPAYHDGDHESAEGATWPPLAEKDCPRCGAVMHTGPEAPEGVVCATCQEEEFAAAERRSTL